MSDTHGEIIVLPNGHFAFVDGVPDTCKHDWSGPTVLITASRKVITWRTFREWAGYTDQLRLKLIQFRLRAMGEIVVEGTSECKHCGKIYQPDWNE